MLGLVRRSGIDQILVAPNSKSILAGGTPIQLVPVALQPHTPVSAGTEPLHGSLSSTAQRLHLLGGQCSAAADSNRKDVLACSDTYAGITPLPRAVTPHQH